MAETHFSGPVHSAAGFVGNVTGTSTGTHTGSVAVPSTGFLTLRTSTFAARPAATTAGQLLYITGSGGTPANILCYSDGTSWLRSDTGLAVA